MKQNEIDQYPEDAAISSSQLSPARLESGSKRSPSLRRLTAVTAAMGFSLALMFGGATASQATPATNGFSAFQVAVAANTDTVAQPMAIGWKIFDGSEIRTSRNCEARRDALRDIYSWDPTVYFMCEEYTAGTGYTFWLVQIGYDNSARMGNIPEAGLAANHMVPAAS